MKSLMVYKTSVSVLEPRSMRTESMTLLTKLFVSFS